MSDADNILWFKENFSAKIAKAVKGTVFDVDMLTAIACQETSSLWGRMRKKPSLTVDQIVALCCGDTLDADKGRKAFPKTKAELIAVPQGQAMFDIARKALVDMATHNPDYAFAFNKKNKFCHGFGIFQYDLQFFLVNPSYFLNRDYEKFENTLDHALGELRNGLKKLGLQNRASITDLEFCHVAICYNTGGFKASKGLRQGHEDNGKFYGEFIRDYLALARTIAVAGGTPALTPPQPGEAITPPPAVASANGPSFRVQTMINTLRLRSEPKVTNPTGLNVVAELPDGQVVRSFTGKTVQGFVEVEATLGGTVFRGFAAKQFLVPLSSPQAAAAIKIAAPVAALAAIPEANLIPAAGSITKRTGIAGALSLNEANMPERKGDTPEDLRSDLAGIIAYLEPERVTHKRYLPRDGLTFCNIYTHDYCKLGGVYLPRTWWSESALLKIAAGQTVAAKLGSTVDEIRANGLFRWLRDFGESFGWRRAASLTELQDHANLGGVCLIVARRKEEGRSGHIVAVVPETADDTAKRDSAGKVTMPLQSQAGAVNFSYGRSTLNWWLDDRFAESAFWIHA